jgi:TetR/AcrR family transcriptional regulator, mexJK operon transcriptional repressor
MHSKPATLDQPTSVSPASAARAEPKSKAAAILAAAERAFLAGGFGAVSMDAIARAAGVSKATVYAHFVGKEELFGAVVADLSRRRFGGFSAEALDPRDIARSLSTIAVRFLDLILSPEAIALNRIIIGEVTRFPALGEVFWEAGPARTRVQIEALLRRAAAAGSLAVPDPRLAAEQFLALARGEIHQRSLLCLDDPDDPGIVVAAESAVETFLRAFRPDTEAAPPAQGGH